MKRAAATVALAALLALGAQAPAYAAHKHHAHPVVHSQFAGVLHSTPVTRHRVHPPRPITR